MGWVPKRGILFGGVLTLFSLGSWTLGVVGAFLRLFGRATTAANLVGNEDTPEKALLRKIIEPLITVPALPWLLMGGSIVLTVYLCLQLSRVARASKDPTAREQGKSAFALLDQTIGLACRLTHELNSYSARLPAITDAKNLTEQLETFVNARWADAEQWLALPKDLLRYSVFLASEQDSQLAFAFGNVEVVKDKDFFEYGKGLAGMVFAQLSRESFNAINPSKHPKWKVLSHKSSFRAILIVLVEYGDGHRLGVLNVTRKRGEKFDPTAVQMMEMLGCVIGHAVGVTEERRAILLRTGQLSQPTQ